MKEVPDTAGITIGQLNRIAELQAEFTTRLVGEIARRSYEGPTWISGLAVEVDRALETVLKEWGEKP